MSQAAQQGYTRGSSSALGGNGKGSGGSGGGCAATNNDTNGGSVADALKALALPAIGAPGMEDGAAVVKAGKQAFEQVERVAEALQLPWDQVHTVLVAVKEATEEVGQCHKFVGSKYKRLRRACLDGNEVLVHKWVQGMVDGRNGL